VSVYVQGLPQVKVACATLDLDVTAAPTKVNLKRLEAALKELKATLRVPDPDEVIVVTLDAKMLAGMSVATMVTRYGPFDLLFAPAGSPGYQELKQRAVEVVPFRMPFRVASIEDLIAMKRAAGREKDIVHLTALLEFLRQA